MDAVNAIGHGPHAPPRTAASAQPRRLVPLLAGWVLLLCACQPEAPSKAPPDALGTAAPGPMDQVPPTAQPLTGQPLTDHHVHLLSAQLVQDWRSLGARFSRSDAAYQSPDALLLGSDATTSVQRVLLVPMAHLYANHEFRAGLGLDLTQEQARVRAENEHVAAQARRWPGRAAALCSINPLRPYARAEIAHCRSQTDVIGLKLHFASNGIDLRQPDHLAVLARLAAEAEQAGQLLLVHLDPQLRGHEAEHISAFAETVLAPHPDLTVIIAHLGGSGGYGPWTQTVFRTLLDFLERTETAGRPLPRLYFDLSAVYLPQASEGVPATTPEEARTLATDLRRAGTARLLPGSDHPVFTLQQTLDALQQQVGLNPDEIDAIRNNQLPGLFAD